MTQKIIRTLQDDYDLLRESIVERLRVNGAFSSASLSLC